MTTRQPSVNGVVKNGSSREKRPEPYTTTTVRKALIGEQYRALRRSPAVALLSNANVPFPAQLPDISEEDSFPLRISTVSDRELSDLASYWGAQYARVQGLLSLARAEGKRLATIKGIEEKKIFDTIRPANPRSTFVDALWGEVYKRPRIRELGQRVREMESLETVYEGLVRGFQTYVSIIQGEMTWRMSERRALRE